MDRRDWEIYKLLKENGRIKLTEIGRKLDITHPSVKERLENLIRRRDVAVKGLLNIKKLKFVCGIVNIQTNTMENAVKLADIFARCPRTIFVATTTGKYNLNIVLVAEKHSVLSATIENSIRPLRDIKNMEISIGESPFYPEFIEFKTGELETAPCGKKCPDCYMYGNGCYGCPATIHFKPSMER